MAKLTLIVKGNRHEAAKAATERGIGLAFIRETRGDTLGQCGDQHLAAVQAWFNEPPHVAPYPVGALLHWSQVESKKIEG